MIVFLNGEFVPEEQALVSVFDRGFLYGDGLFEAVRVAGARPFLLRRHLDRLSCGARFLQIRMPLGANEWETAARELIRRNEISEGILRVALSRGVGRRGYSMRGADQPSFVMSLHPLPAGKSARPPQWRLMTSSLRIPALDPLAHHKTSNKLRQILARTEAEAQSADEALLLDTDGKVAEAAGSNLFWMESETVCTPPLTSGILPGVTRELVLEICRDLGLPTLEKQTEPGSLSRMDGVFVTLSGWGVVEVLSLDGRGLRQSPVTGRIRRAYEEVLERGRD